MTALNRERIEKLLLALDESLARRDVSADVYLVGGAAMALAFDITRATRDLDGVFRPASEVRMAADEVAEQQGLAEGWLNDAVKAFVPPGYDEGQQVVFESPNLRVCVASAEHMLAMKVAAARVEQDRNDLLLLINALGITSVSEALEVTRKCLGPSYPIPQRAEYLLQEILET